MPSSRSSAEPAHPGAHCVAADCRQRGFDHHLVAAAQGLVVLGQRGRAALVLPLACDGCAHLGQWRGQRRCARRHAHQMLAEGRRHRAGPCVERQLLEFGRELATEVARRQVERRVLRARRQHGRLPEPRRVAAALCGCARRLQHRSRCRGGEVDLLEADRARPGETFGVLFQIGGQVRIGGCVARPLLLGDHLELLPHAPLDDRVVAVQSQRHALAVEDLVAHVGVHQPGQFLLGRRPAPARAVLERHAVDHRLRDDDARAGLVRRRQPAIGHEQQQADQQKVQDRFLHQQLETQARLHTRKRGRAPDPAAAVRGRSSASQLGEYQIGELQARSCSVAGTLVSGAICCRTAS